MVIATSERLTPEVRSRLAGAVALIEKSELRREAFAPSMRRLRPEPEAS